MTDIDAALARMATIPLPAGLDAIDGRVLARIAAGPAVPGVGAGLLAILMAAGLGMVAGGAAGPVQVTLPFGIEDAPAPSRLLG